MTGMAGMADVGSGDLVTGGKPFPAVQDGLHFDEDVIDLAILTSLGLVAGDLEKTGAMVSHGALDSDAGNP